MFKALLDRISGVRTIIVEKADRLARKLIVQETDHRILGAGIETSPPTVGALVEDTPTTPAYARIAAQMCKLGATDAGLAAALT